MLMCLLLEIKDKISFKSQLIKCSTLMCVIGTREAESSLKSGIYSGAHLSVTTFSECLWSLNSPSYIHRACCILFWFCCRDEKFIVPFYIFWCLYRQCVGGQFALFQSVCISIPSYSVVLKHQYPQRVCFHVFPLLGQLCQMGFMQIVQLLPWYIARCFLFIMEYTLPLAVLSTLIFLLKSFWFIFMASSLFSF